MKLYVEHYSRLFQESWKPIIFAAREWVLRDYHRSIMQWLNFTRRAWVDVKLFHNIPQNHGNNRFIRDNLEKKWVELMRISHQAETFYDEVLRLISEISWWVEKLILLERNTLLKPNGERLNTVSVDRMKERAQDRDYDFWDISKRNINFHGTLSTICDAIMSDVIHRVHILKAWERDSIKNELFSIDGSWTLLGKDFWNPEVCWAQQEEIDIIFDMLRSDASWLIKSRSRDYIASNINNFLVARIDWYPVWCVEKIDLDKNTIELWALFVIESFLSQRIGRSLVTKFCETAQNANKDIVCMTNNPKLQSMLESLWFTRADSWDYPERKRISPHVQMFLHKQN